LARSGVRGTFSQPGPSHPAASGRLTRTLGLTMESSLDLDKTNSCSATLDMVCAPIPNSVAAKLVGVAEAEAVIRQSDFYMICGRAEAKFLEVRPNFDLGRLEFDIEVPGQSRDSGWIELKEVLDLPDDSEKLKFEVAHDDVSICILRRDSDGEEQLVAGFSPDDILFHRGRKSPAIGGLASGLSLATFDLLYVGIAKVGDSYDRLFAKGHFARQQILANEPQRFPGARVSDETYLLLFQVEPLFVRTFGPESEVEDEDLDYSYEHKRLVADAEKAFVHLLRPNYNNTLYANYPKGRDGLYGSGYTAYTYSISDGISLLTKFGKIKGGREQNLTLSNEADFIFVKGDEVTFHISGVDFPAD
jgi:hypothetical protein